MPLTPGTHHLGPGDGELLVHTFREGVAQKVGHDLILEVGAWSASVEVGATGAPVSAALEADPRSLRVRRGLHGAKPLTDSDRASIRDNIVKKVLGTTPIGFRSAHIDAASGALVVTGELSMAGARETAAFAATLHDDGRLSGTVTLRQSDWGITPYRALMGALKVRDEVDVTIDVRLPAH